MKVAELIEKLKQFPQDLEVWASGTESQPTFDIQYVEIAKVENFPHSGAAGNVVLF